MDGSKVSLACSRTSCWPQGADRGAPGPAQVLGREGQPCLCPLPTAPGPHSCGAPSASPSLHHKLGHTPPCSSPGTKGALKPGRPQASQPEGCGLVARPRLLSPGPAPGPLALLPWPPTTSGCFCFWTVGSALRVQCPAQALDEAGPRRGPGYRFHGGSSSPSLRWTARERRAVPARRLRAGLGAALVSLLWSWRSGGSAGVGQGLRALGRAQVGALQASLLPAPKGPPCGKQEQSEHLFSTY